MAEEERGESVEAFTSGIKHLLMPVVQDCDAHIRAVIDSQNSLSRQIDIVNFGK